MSICPNKDLHSVYLDNELPESYKAEYEKHVADCPKCQAELKKLKAVRNLFADDRNTLNLLKRKWMKVMPAFFPACLTARM